KTVIVHVDDGTFNESREFVISVEEVPVNSPPELNLMATYTAKYNETFTVKPVDLYDEDGDELSVWYDWGDGTPMTEGDPADLFRANHSYNATEPFTLKVYADDNTGLVGHNVSATATVTVSEGNLKPTIVTKSKSPDQTAYSVGEEILFNITVRDTEGDEITVKIDFGDGSAVESRILTPTAPGQNLSTSFNHTYESEGEFTVTIWAEDEYDHSAAWASGTWTVEVEDEGGGGLNIALIAGIGLLAIIAIIVAAMLLKKRGGKTEGDEAGGMEGGAPPEEPPLEEPPSSS
ncbi:MAG: PKD domain-containing protein, partial [Thermoplasmata archaeon]